MNNPQFARDFGDDDFEPYDYDERTPLYESETQEWRSTDIGHTQTTNQSQSTVRIFSVLKKI